MNRPSFRASPRLVMWALTSLLVLLCAAALLPLQRRLALTRQTTCAANLKQIAQACRQYADDHDGALPGYEACIDEPRDFAQVKRAMAYPLDALLPYVPRDTWRCPASASAANRAGTSYLYAGFGRGPVPLDLYPPQYVPVAWDLKPCHPGRSRTVAFLDEHVEPGWSRGIVLVSPRTPWAGRSGLVLRKGQRVTLSAGGQWTGNFEAVPQGLVPPLSPAPPSSELLCTSLPACGLIGRVGNGEPFAVGYGGESPADASGELVLSMNESDRQPRFWKDNAGLMWVFVRVTSP